MKTLEELKELWNKGKLSLKNNNKCTVEQLNEAIEMLNGKPWLSCGGAIAGDFAFYNKKYRYDITPTSKTIKVTSFLNRYKFCRPIKTTLTDEQIEAVLNWMRKDNSIPIESIEAFKEKFKQ